MKKFWLHSLLRLYTMILIGVLSFVAVLVSYASWQSNQVEADRVIERVMSRTLDQLDYYYQRSLQLSQTLVNTSGKQEGLYRYFSLNSADYQRWKLQYHYENGGSVSIHDSVSAIYAQNDFVEELAIALQDNQKVFVSSRTRPGGEQVAAKDFQPKAASFPISLYDVTTGDTLGIAYVTINEASISQSIRNSGGNFPLTVRVTSPYDKEILLFSSKKGTPPRKWFVRETTHGYQIKVGLASGYVLQHSLTNTVLIVGMSGVLIWILYTILVRIFANYQRQVIDIVDTLQLVTQTEGVRIDTKTKEDELFLVADNINQMLDTLDANIRDIYELRLLQQEANMRALQAQINPHFMYNTLEFIRMYAVMHDQEELGDVIYEFSRLLRNNISDEKTTTLASELEFCRKYSYLCMVRYPKSVAYGFKIDENLEEMIIPKFTIQPLVENYFAHGIDHRQLDNVISVKALHRLGEVEIRIEDNGRGMTTEQLENIRQQLAQREFRHDQHRKSIGIVNVHERMVLFFGERYQIFIDSNEGAGVSYRILIRDEENDV
ncbi:Two-component sensor kinase YesM [Streptococcus sp. DD10]|uniref:sensor histidine kinase n=1 Tax=Streptococcus sp. DD10 TaxID=1777878 RepID=UPI00079A5C75|nr:sensor histidine kinase [Streptococcus sp. DD10]KXT73030.1 Two-component sensor kinase YesM [Streptococcus sp. DD10]